MTFGGVRAKAMLPWVRGSTRAWLFAGFGYTGVYSRSYRTTLSVANGDGSLEPRPVRIEGAGGGFFDVPFGLGASYRFFKPWELCAELGGRFGFGHQGSAYEHPGPSITGSSAAENASPAGLDRLAIGLALGILVDL